MDVFTVEKRSQIMARVTGKNTKPEMSARKILHRLGYRFRLHRKDLPGRPDIVLPKYKTVIFVHGCFWHQHCGCRKAARPTSNSEFWQVKLDKNVARDAKTRSELEMLGWHVIILWECSLKDTENIVRTLEQIRHKANEGSCLV